MMIRNVTVAACLAVVLGACAVNPTTGEREATKTGKGAGIGAAVGAVVGVLSGDDADERRRRALIGAGVGALAGSAVGYYMDKQEAKLRESLAESGVQVRRQGDDLVLNMPHEITFDVNRSDLNAQFLPVLDSVGEVLQDFESTLIDVVGHTDSTGSYDYNLSLSQKRAHSVSSYLQRRGVQPVRIYTDGVGPSRPVADNQTVSGRAQNRRVELVLRPLVEENSRR